LFERAVALDANYALAYAALGRCLIEMENVGSLSRPEAQRDASAALQRAVAISSDLPDAEAALADLRFYWLWDWGGAGTAYRRALELNPSLAEARVRYAYYLAAQGRVDEGLSEVARAQDIDPWSPHGGDTGMMLYYAHRFDDAIAQLESRIEQEPNQALRRFTLARAYAAADRTGDAKRELQKAIELSGGPGEDRARTFELELARLLAQEGQAADARLVLERTKGDPLLAQSPSLQAYRGLVHATLGERNEAIRWLEQAVNGRSAQLLWAEVDPRFDPLRGDPQFERLMVRVRSGQ
jgi:tetratricopeptide (TPR) repeat protein